MRLNACQIPVFILCYAKSFHSQYHYHKTREMLKRQQEKIKPSSKEFTQNKSLIDQKGKKNHNGDILRYFKEQP